MHSSRRATHLAKSGFSLYTDRPQAHPRSDGPPVGFMGAYAKDRPQARPRSGVREHHFDLRHGGFGFAARSLSYGAHRSRIGSAASNVVHVAFDH